MALISWRESLRELSYSSSNPAQHLLGTILTLSGKRDDGDRHFHRILEHLQSYGMRLEYPRALRNYGSVLLQCSSPGRTDYLQGRSYLGLAWEAFLECDAKIEAEGVKHFLGGESL